MAAETILPTEEKSVLETLDAETAEKINTALLNWESVEESVRAAVDAELKDSEAAAELVIEAIGASERLSEDDMAIRINTRE